MQQFYKKVPSLHTLLSDNNDTSFYFGLLGLLTIFWPLCPPAAGLWSSRGHYCTGAELRAECSWNAEGPSGKWLPQYSESWDPADTPQWQWWNKRYYHYILVFYFCLRRLHCSWCYLTLVRRISANCEEASSLIAVDSWWQRLLIHQKQLGHEGGFKLWCLARRRHIQVVSSAIELLCLLKNSYFLEQHC